MKKQKLTLFFQGDISIETGTVMGTAKLIADHTQTECVKQNYMLERITAKLTAPVLRIHHVRPPRWTGTQDNAYRISTVLTEGNQETVQIMMRLRRKLKEKVYQGLQCLTIPRRIQKQGVTKVV